MTRKSSDSLNAGKLSSHRVYTGRVLSLDIDKVRFPNGTMGDLEMIRHSGASAIVPLLSAESMDPEVLLIKQYRYAAGGFVYEIPAGRLDPGESPEACARRELMEETGYVAGNLHELTTIFTTPGFTDERIHIFVGDGMVEGTAQREADEFLELFRVRLSDAITMVRSGEIVDGKTIVGLLLTQLTLKTA